MALSTTTLKIYPFPQGKDNTQRRLHLSGVVSISASPGTYATGGLPLNWAILSNTLTGATELLDTTSTAPIMAYFTSVAGSGFLYGWNKATNKIQIFTTGTATQSAQAELAAGAMPAGVSGDVIEFDASFVRAN
jgi:hypothetical protein